jgi:biotin carboxylase
VNPGLLLILGGNRMAVPAIELLERSSCRTLVLDRDATAPARAVASRFLAVNFSDAAATRAAVADVPLSGVLPLNDFAVRTAAALAQERGLRGLSPNAAFRVTNKVAMKRAWSKAGLPTAEWTWAKKADILAGRFPCWQTFPCIVKPAFSGGGSRGVGLAHGWPDVQAIVAAGAAKYLDEEVVIEEFIEGSEHTVEMIIAGSETHLLSISDKENYPGSVTVVQKLRFPGPVGQAHRHLIEPLVAASAHALGLDYGATHTEVLIRGGRVYLLEVGGRPGGGINWHPICELSTGYNYPTILASVLTGATPDYARKPHVHLAWHYFDHGPGTIAAIGGFDELAREPNVVAAEMYDQVGRPGLDKRDDLARPGFVLVKANAPERAAARASELVARVEFVMAGERMPNGYPKWTRMSEGDGIAQCINTDTLRLRRCSSLLEAGR